MPAIIKTFSKKLNASVRNFGVHSTSKNDKKNKQQPTTSTANTSSSIVAPNLEDPYKTLTSQFDRNACVQNKQEEETVPGFVPSDNSSEDSSTEDESDAAEKYGYGNAAPDEPKTEKILGISTPQYKRASLNRRNRRASISATPTAENIGDSVNVPFHPQRTPRRSSLKGMSNSATIRRASIAASAFDAVDLKTLQEIDPESVLEVQLPGRRDSIKRRRSITFNEDVHVRKIQPAKNLTNKPKELWFQDDEYSTIKRKTRALLESVDKETGLVNGKKYCVRGLERYMEPSHIREAKKYSAWDSVLIEQQFQRQDGTFDDESIGKLYSTTTTKSVLDARRQAAKDAKEVASFYDKENELSGGTPARRGRRASVA